MSDWPKKIDAMARQCLAQDIRGVSGMASWALVLFQRVLELARQEGRGAATIREIWPGFRLFMHGGVRSTARSSRRDAARRGDGRRRRWTCAVRH
jgi:hypothetical protein